MFSKLPAPLFEVARVGAEKPQRVFLWGVGVKNSLRDGLAGQDGPPAGCEAASARLTKTTLFVSRGSAGPWTAQQKGLEPHRFQHGVDRILVQHRLAGRELITFGDGYVEIENTAAVGGLAIGVASNEAERQGLDAWKRQRLIEAGADIIIPDFREYEALLQYLGL